MNCRETQASFDERLDRRLNVAEMAAFDAHINVCTACAAHWRAYAGVWTALEKQTVPHPSIGFAERTLRRLDEPTSSESVWHIWPVWRWVMVSGLAVALAAGWVGLKQNHKQNHTARLAAAKSTAEVYVMANQDRLEDFDVIANLHLLNEGGRR